MELYENIPQLLEACFSPGKCHLAELFALEASSGALNGEQGGDLRLDSIPNP